MILVGHSYGGMVATGVVDRARKRISALIYVDAHVPRDGDSISSLTPERFEGMKKLAEEKGEGRPGDHFRKYLERAKSEGWDVYEIDLSYNLHINIQYELADIIEKNAKSKS